MENNIELRPFHIACVSGGKDSLYMLSYIIQHHWENVMDIRKHEKAPHKYWGRYSADDIDNIIHTKWLNKLNEKEGDLI